MRHGLRILPKLALLLTLWGANAVAQDEEEAGDPKKKEDAKEGEGEKKGAGLMEEGGDPADREKSDRGPYTPSGKTGELAEEAEAKGEAGKKGEKKFIPPPRKPIQVFGEFLIGFGGVPVPGPQDTTPEATLLTITLGGSYDFSKKFSLGLRVPWTTGSFDDDRGQSVSSQALGAPELFMEYRAPLSPRTDLPFRLGIGVPVAQGNPDFTNTPDQAGIKQAFVNHWADAVSGWRDGELFGPKRLPVTPQFGIRHQRSRLKAEAWTKLVFGFLIGDDLSQPEQTDGTLTQNSVAIRSVTGAGVRYTYLESPSLFAGLDSWFVYKLVEEIEFQSRGQGDEPSTFQLVFEPKLGATFGAVTASVGYVLPIGGQLGDANSQGVRLGIAAEF
jgi:hypothetical protein